MTVFVFALHGPQSRTVPSNPDFVQPPCRPILGRASSFPTAGSSMVMLSPGLSCPTPGSCAYMKTDLRVGSGSCRVFLRCLCGGNDNKQQDETSQPAIAGSLRRRKVNASTFWYLGGVKWERSFLLIKLPQYVLYSIPRPLDFKASSTTRS
ncbi:hypothetical protein ARMGADRAFT_443079 [Armillaria gallica]|uniref:Uncharacterized protein n=1 Tax=Armillaria gallica TaxID=47427 RepID=A0A2H3D217_ARMGA|nr:hypothetical protein ARMGADRAFT_443079 [Armillaria gallica]